MAIDYLLQENGDRISLEDGSGFLILERSGGGLVDGDEVEVVIAGGIESRVLIDAGIRVRVVIESPVKITVLHEGGTPVKVVI
jgi:hypothetical protein